MPERILNNSTLCYTYIIGTTTGFTIQGAIGFFGTVLGALSALMLVCINYEKFTQSKPVTFLMAKIRRK